MKKERYVGLHIEADLYEAIDAYAKLDNRKFGAFVRDVILKQWLAKTQEQEAGQSAGYPHMPFGHLLSKSLKSKTLGMVLKGIADEIGKLSTSDLESLLRDTQETPADEEKTESGGRKDRADHKDHDRDHGPGVKHGKRVPKRRNKDG